MNQETNETAGSIPESSEKINTFEAIRRARLEKIQLDIAMRKIKLQQAETEQNLNVGAVIPMEDVVRALNGFFRDIPEGRKCKGCYSNMEARIKNAMNLE